MFKDRVADNKQKTMGRVYPLSLVSCLQHNHWYPWFHLGYLLDPTGTVVDALTTGLSGRLGPHHHGILRRHGIRPFRPRHAIWPSPHLLFFSLMPYFCLFANSNSSPRALLRVSTSPYSGMETQASSELYERLQEKVCRIKEILTNVSFSSAKERRQNLLEVSPSSLIPAMSSKMYQHSPFPS